MVVRRVERDIDVRELLRQHLLRRGEHDVAPLALAHAAEEHHVVDGVELRVLGQGVSKVNANSLVELRHLCLFLRILHGLLDHLQALRMDLVLDREHVRVGVHVVLRHGHAALCRELRGAALAEVHVRAAGVHAAVPGVPGARGAEVDPHVTHLVNPAGQVAVLVGVAGALVAAHGDAHDVPRADLRRGGERGDLAVVDDLQWHVAGHLLGDPGEDVDNLLFVHIPRHVREDIAPRGLVVGAHRAGGAATNSLDLRQLLRCELQSRHHSVVVVLGIRVGHIPLRLLGVQDLPVLHGHRLDVTLAEVEGQAAPGGVLAHLLGRVLGLGHLVDGGDDLHLEGLLGRAADVGHGRDLEFVGAALRERALQGLADAGRPTEQQLIAAALPEHLLDQHAGQEGGRHDVLGLFGKHGQGVAGAAVRSHEGPVQLVLAVLGGLQVLLLSKHDRRKVRVQGRRNRGCHEEQLLRCRWHGSQGLPCALWLVTGIFILLGLDRLGAQAVGTNPLVRGVGVTHEMNLHGGL
mmetsp:Transcript_86996/g.211104  ORF Transcript_86996/g.211104 Transcript_86996/m.211104 type:complete len:520 (+) Transcript_86996:161-1720(+)